MAIACRPADARRAPDLPTTLHLARIFSNGVVLQRGVDIPVWGWASPTSTVSVEFRGVTRTATAARDGAWKVTFPAEQAGGPYALQASADTARIDVQNILIGDVWVASGQSNMEFVLADAKDGAATIAAAHDSALRHFKVPTSWGETPLADVTGGDWQQADPQHAGSFTAVGYFFAQELRKATGVPIGILHTSWGGSRIEPWMSRSVQSLDDAKWASLMEQEHQTQAKMLSDLRARIGVMPERDEGLVDGKALWANPALDDHAWADLPIKTNWEDAGYPGMDGTAWYRTTFELSQDDLAKPIHLALGPVDDADISWVNGVEVGRTSGWMAPRVYAVPTSALHAGTNVLAVRVEDTGGGGGLYGDSARYVDVGGQHRDLPARWKFKVGAVSIQPDGQHINKVPSLVYHAMVQPILDFPIKGVIWYQGESNADHYEDAVAYRPLFANLITSWRRTWASNAPLANGERDFPFLWVQLANYMDVDSEPRLESNWAALRESQSAALTLPRTAQAVIIDIGETKDIHPKNKRDVGHRLALAARAIAYDEHLEYSGPVFRSQAITGNRVTLAFDHVGNGLRAQRGPLGGFAIAGADRHFVWANARIEGDHVVVWSDRVSAPVAVRYAWANNPLSANLYNADGLPASPFRTDTW